MHSVHRQEDFITLTAGMGRFDVAGSGPLFGVAVLQPAVSVFQSLIFRRNNGRLPPLFSLTMWNLFDKITSKENRTYNYAEAGHRRLQTGLQMQHPSIWKFIDALRNIYYEQLVAGNRSLEKLKKYRMVDERILYLVTNFVQRDILEYHTIQ